MTTSKLDAQSNSNPKTLPADAVPNEVEEDVRSLQELLKDHLDLRSFATSGLLILAGLYTLYFARPFLLPIILAILCTLLLRPIVRALVKLRFPEPLAAAVVVLVLVGALVGGAYGLSGPASAWLREAPDVAERVEARIAPLLRPMTQMTRATQQMEEKIAGASSSTNSDVPLVEVKEPGLGDTLFTQVTRLIGATMIVIILLYFLLASGDLFLRKLVQELPNFKEKKRAVEIAHEIQQNVSTYLLTVSAIYFGLGIAVAVAMFLLGMPNPILWGVLACCLNFIPYLGATITLVILAAVAILTFDNLSYAMLVPAVFLVLTTIEGYIVTPLILGRRLTLNPVVIFIGMTFWWWLWGIPGALLAVPLLAILKIVCERVEALVPVSTFLGK